MKSRRPSEYYRLEKIYLKECPETGFYQYNHDGVNFCMYEGKMSCRHRKPIKPEKGAGFLCDLVLKNEEKKE